MKIKKSSKELKENHTSFRSLKRNPVGFYLQPICGNNTFTYFQIIYSRGKSVTIKDEEGIPITHYFETLEEGEPIYCESMMNAEQQAAFRALSILLAPLSQRALSNDKKNRRKED